MLSSRALQMSASMLRAPVARGSAQKIFNQTRGLRLQATPKLRMPVPKEEHSGRLPIHSRTPNAWRLRTLRKIPPELIPIGVVLAVALSFAAYSLGKKLFTDGTLRLYRTRGHNQASSPQDTKPH
ncbi:hypothetical protein BDV97DRAFT_402059 [Delphinella strobiligena]|nr:hypothetical protein BDV97DRAFT_402059 [Delphinella strobiligena]